MDFGLPDNLPAYLLETRRINKTHKKWKKYIQLNQKYLRKTFDLQMNYPENTLHVPLRKMKEQLGRFKVGSKRIYAWDEFYKIMPFFSIHQKGNNITQKDTEILIHDKALIRKLFECMEIEEGEIYQLTHEDVISLPRIPINRKSLNNLIETLDNNLENPSNNSYRQDQLKRQRDYAKRILDWVDFATEDGDEDQLPYIEEKHVFGRTYHKGINLISCPRNVRHAALGDCYEYDLENAVLSVKFNVLSQMVGNSDYKKFLSFEYLTNKKHVRKVLTEAVSQAFLKQGKKSYKRTNEDMVKQALTAITFGAPASDKSWIKQDGLREYGALSSTIKNPQALEAFLNEDIYGSNQYPFVKTFSEEQKIIDELILSDKDVEEMLTEAIDKNPELQGKLKHKNGRWKKSSCMVFLYQQIERQIMDFVKAKCDCLLHVHDAIYTRKPIHLSKINAEIQEKFGAYIRLSETKINATSIGGFNAELEKHKAFIKSEQIDALRYEAKSQSKK